MENLLKDLASRINVELSDVQIEKFLIYMKELKDWNEKINLTAITDDSDIILKHFVDSLTIVKYVSDKDKLIDVGTGAGFPGIPIKIVKPNVELSLLDSLNKRILFLEDVLGKISVENVLCIHGRAEDVSRETNHREMYDVATARAVANLSTLAELCLPFVKIGGFFVCMKGNNIDEVENAKKAIDVLGGKIEKIDKFLLPNSDIERNIIVIRKVKSTPNQYPRKAGVPAKQPII